MDGGIKIAASLNPQGAYPADIRETPVATVAELLNWDFTETPIPEGHEILCLADGIKYEYRSTNNEPASGKFKAPTSDGGEIPDNSIAEEKLDEELRTKIDSKLDDKDVRSFTQAEWDALTTAQQNSYTLAIVT